MASVASVAAAAGLENLLHFNDATDSLEIRLAVLESGNAGVGKNCFMPYGLY